MAAEIDENTARCRMGEMALQLSDEQGAPVAGVEVKAEQESHDFLFGCAYPTWHRGNREQSDTFAELFSTLFNGLITEMALRWRSLEPRKGQYNWKVVDDMVAWAESNNIAVKGHTLVWGNGPKGSGTPRWLLNKPKETVRKLLNKRIRKVVGRYADRISHWDVVNEPCHATWFEEQIGLEYIGDCFRWARESDPKAKLLINEYDIIGFRKERKAFINLLTELRDSGVPIDGVGLEAHPGSRWLRREEIEQSLDEVGRLGWDIHISELTVPIERQPIRGRDEGGVWTPDTQAEYLDMFYRTAFAHPNVKAIILWGLWDEMIWQSNAGLLDADFTRKPAFDVLDGLINREWRTSMTLDTDDEGRCTLSGYLGNYTIEAEVGGRALKGTVHLGDDVTEETVTLSPA